MRDVRVAEARGVAPHAASAPRAGAKPDDEVSDDPSVRRPRIAPPARWRERHAPACEACEAARVPCVHHPEVPLKLLIIGHNPSEHSWDRLDIF